MAVVIDWWRRRIHAHLAPTPGLMALLMKPRNGQPWTADERLLLRRELHRLARWTPALLFLLIPGSLLLLPVYAWLLDRRRWRRDAGAPRL